MRTNPDGSIECAVIQLRTVGTPRAPEPGEGWYYDDFSMETDTSCDRPGIEGQRIAFTPGAIPPNGVNVNLECLQRIQGSGGGTGTDIQVGTFCDTASDICPTAAGMSLVCEPNSRTCQVGCATNANCPSSLVCDTESGAGYCVNPICID